MDSNYNYNISDNQNNNMYQINNFNPVDNNLLNYNNNNLLGQTNINNNNYINYIQPNNNSYANNLHYSIFSSQNIPNISGNNNINNENPLNYSYSYITFNNNSNNINQIGNGIDFNINNSLINPQKTNIKSKRINPFNLTSNDNQYNNLNSKYLFQSTVYNSINKPDVNANNISDIHDINTHTLLMNLQKTNNPNKTINAFSPSNINNNNNFVKNNNNNKFLSKTVINNRANNQNINTNYINNHNSLINPHQTFNLDKSINNYNLSNNNKNNNYYGQINNPSFLIQNQNNINNKLPSSNKSNLNNNSLFQTTVNNRSNNQNLNIYPNNININNNITNNIINPQNNNLINNKNKKNLNERLYECPRCHQKLAKNLIHAHLINHQRDENQNREIRLPRQRPNDNLQSSVIRYNNHNQNRNNQGNNRIEIGKVTVFHDLVFFEGEIYSYDDLNKIKSLNLPEITIKDPNKLEEKNKKCMICLENFGANEKVTALPCIHLFHTQCINQWIERRKNCPICKLNLTQ